MFHLTGTKTYDTEDGRHAVFVLDPSSREGTLCEVTHESTDGSGSAGHRNAEMDHRRRQVLSRFYFRGSDQRKVKLKKLDGKTVELDVALLSDADREWLRNRGKWVTVVATA